MLQPSLFCCSLKLSGRRIMSIPVAMVSQNRLKMQNHWTSLDLVSWFRRVSSSHLPSCRRRKSCTWSPGSAAGRSMASSPEKGTWHCTWIHIHKSFIHLQTYSTYQYSIYYVWSDCPWKFVNWSMTKVEMFQILREWFGNSNLRSYNL